MKFKLVIIFIISVFIMSFGNNYVFAKAESTTNERGEEKSIDEITDEILNEIDAEEIEKYFDELIAPFAKSGGLKDFIKAITNGETGSFKDIASYLGYLLSYGFKEQLPSFVSLFALILFSSLLKLIKPSDKSGGAGDLACFAVFTAIVCMVSVIIYGTVSKAGNVIDKMAGFTEAVYPVVLSLTVVCGAGNSAANVTPAALFISDTVIILVKTFIFPIIVFMFVTSIISNLNKSIKLKNLFVFLSGFMKWAIGLFTAVFSLFLGLNGLNSVNLDGLGFKTAKYTMGSAIPFVGGVVGDGLNIMISSAAIIKNAFGTLAVFMVFSVTVVPVFEIIILTLVLRLIAAITEPFSDPRIGEFISGGITVINFVVASLIAVSFMYLITFVAVISCTQYLFL